MGQNGQTIAAPPGRLQFGAARREINTKHGGTQDLQWPRDAEPRARTWRGSGWSQSKPGNPQVKHVQMVEVAVAIGEHQRIAQERERKRAPSRPYANQQCKT